MPNGQLRPASQFTAKLAATRPETVAHRGPQLATSACLDTLTHVQSVRCGWAGICRSANVSQRMVALRVGLVPTPLVDRRSATGRIPVFALVPFPFWTSRRRQNLENLETWKPGNPKAPPLLALEAFCQTARRAVGVTFEPPRSDLHGPGRHFFLLLFFYPPHFIIANRLGS